MSTQDEQIQRLHYFDNQFLKAEDFTTEQEYHLEMRRRHNRVLHTKGVAEGLQIKKTSNKGITLQAGTAIDGNGNEIILLKDNLIDLKDTTKFPNNSIIYIFAYYGEDKAKPQPENSTEENQKTRVFEKTNIKVETTEPDINDKLIIRLGRFKLDKDGNVPDESKFLNSGFREEAAAKIPEFSVSVKQLKTFTKPEWDKFDTILTSKPLEVPVFETLLSPPIQNVGAFILVYAYSTTQNAKFNWSQQYRIDNKKDEQGNDILVQTQYIIFENKTDPAKSIQIKYKIYAVLE